MLAFLFFSCGGGSMDVSKFLAERDSILDVNERQQQELEDVQIVQKEHTIQTLDQRHHRHVFNVQQEHIRHMKDQVLVQIVQ